MDTKEKQRRPAAGKVAQSAPRGTSAKRTTSSRQTAAASSRTASSKTAKSTAANRRPAAPKTKQSAPAAPRKAPNTSSQKGTATRKSAARKPAQERQKKVRIQENVPEVVYLPPKPFSRNRVLVRLLTVTSVVLALLLGISVFFKVERFEVSGNVKYQAWDVAEASDILGDNLLTFSHAKAAGKIQTLLPYVKSVRIGIKLPNTVKIVIEETEVTYSVQASDDSWWLLSSTGKVVEKAATGSQDSHTRLLGIRILDPVAGQQAVVLETTQPQLDEQGNPIPVTYTDAQRLDTALNIVQFLEQSGIIGKAASIDVTHAADIRLWYGKQYLVKLGDSSQLGYKIGLLAAIVDHGGKYDNGILDITLTDKPDGVIWTLFEE